MQARSVRFSNPPLEGRLAVPKSARGVAVLCHAYPPLGGSMSNALLPALQRSLFFAGWAALRFNFRGVGRSEGRFDQGIGETDDAIAALTFAKAETGLTKPALIGWSFGSVVAIRAAAVERVPVVGIAPPVSEQSRIELPAFPFDVSALRGRSLLICGTQDPVSQPSDAMRLAETIGAEVSLIENTGHFFEGHMDEVAAVAIDFLNQTR